MGERFSHPQLRSRRCGVAPLIFLAQDTDTQTVAQIKIPIIHFFFIRQKYKKNTFLKQPRRGKTHGVQLTPHKAEPQCGGLRADAKFCVSISQPLSSIWQVLPKYLASRSKHFYLPRTCHIHPNPFGNPCQTPCSVETVILRLYNVVATNGRGCNFLYNLNNSATISASLSSVNTLGSKPKACITARSLS